MAERELLSIGRPREVLGRGRAIIDLHDPRSICSHHIQLRVATFKFSDEGDFPPVRRPHGTKGICCLKVSAEIPRERQPSLLATIGVHQVNVRKAGVVTEARNATDVSIERDLAIRLGCQGLRFRWRGTVVV